MHSDNVSEFFTLKNHIKSPFNSFNKANTHKELQNKYNIEWYHSTERSTYNLSTRKRYNISV